MMARTAMREEQVYAELLRRAREEAVLASCATLLEWDEDTYLPRAGVEHRGNQLALLAGLHHQLATHPRVGELLGELAGSDFVADPHSPAAINVRELGRTYARLTRLPRGLVEELTRTTTLAQHEWAAAHEHADFARFQPWLEKIISLKRCEAQCLDFHAIPYDALLDEFDPGSRSREIARLFEA